MSAKEAMKLQEEMFKDPEFMVMMDKKAVYCFQEEHRDEETLQDKIKV